MHRRFMKQIVLTALSLVLGLSTSVLAQDRAVMAEDKIDALVERALVDFNIPGIGIGIIKDGEVVIAKGYGIRDIRGDDKVNGDTLFQIASNSKAYTAATIALLVDEGKLDWDDKVTKHIPEFKMFDPYVTREFTIRDMLSHRSGLPLGAGDLLFFPDPVAEIDDVLNAVAMIPPSSSFRSKYDYDNAMYILAGELVARVAGMPWSDFVEQRIFKPLNMTDCRATYLRVPKGANIATPHAMDGETLVVRDFMQHEVTGSVGGINCSVNSSLKWLKTQLNHGVMDSGEPLFSKARHGEMWSPVTIMNSVAPKMPGEPVRTTHYALGWRISPLPNGTQTISHTGGLDGMLTSTLMLPEENMGLVVFTNQANGWARNAIISNIMADYFGEKEAFGYDARVKGSKARSSGAVEAMQKIWDARDKAKQATYDEEAYAMTYRDSWYGDIEIIQEDGVLRFFSKTSPSLVGTIKHFEGDTFVVEWDDRSMVADAYMDFQLDDIGNIAGIKMRKFDPRTDFSYDFWHLNLKAVKE